METTEIYDSTGTDPENRVPNTDLHVYSNITITSPPQHNHNTTKNPSISTRMSTAASKILQDSNVVEKIMGFDGDCGYIFLAPVSKVWKESWGTRDRTTAFVTRGRTCNQLRDTVKGFLADAPETRYNPLRTAVCLGRLDLVKWVHPLGFEINAVPCGLAAAAGHAEILVWLRKAGYPWDWNTCRLAARFGHLEILEYAFDGGCEWKKSATNEAIKHGRIEVLEWALEKNLFDKKKLQRGACDLGNAEVLEWASAKKYGKWAPAYGTVAAGHGHLKVLKWIFGRTVRFTGSVYARTVLFQEKRRLRLSRDTTSKDGTERVYGKKASEGRLNVLRWLSRFTPAQKGYTPTPEDFESVCGSRSVGFMDWMMKDRVHVSTIDQERCAELAIAGDENNLTEGHNDFELRETLEWMSENFTSVGALGIVALELVELSNR